MQSVLYSLLKISAITECHFTWKARVCSENNFFRQSRPSPHVLVCSLHYRAAIASKTLNRDLLWQLWFVDLLFCYQMQVIQCFCKIKPKEPLIIRLLLSLQATKPSVVFICHCFHILIIYFYHLFLNLLLQHLSVRANYKFNCTRSLCLW